MPDSCQYNIGTPLKAGTDKIYHYHLYRYRQLGKASLISSPERPTNKLADIIIEFLINISTFQYKFAGIIIEILSNISTFIKILSLDYS